MSDTWLIRLYRAILSLYPSGFRAEFADEMGEVFSQAALDARRKSLFALFEVILVELRDLPTSLLRAHRQARRSLRAAADTLKRISPVELTWQLFATLAVFLIPAAALMLHGTPHEFADRGAGVPAAALFLIAMLVVGMLRRLPLRSLPYLGITLILSAYLYVFQWVADLVTPSLISNFAPGAWDHSTYLLLKTISAGMLWMTLFSLTLLVIALLALYNRFQPLCWSIRHDWSLLSFVLHGEVVFALLLLAERHRYERPFAIACLLWLAAGAWLYLRSSQRWKRAIALLSGLALGAWAVASGIAAGAIFGAGENLVILSVAALNGNGQLALAQLWGEAGRILVIPIWLLLILLLPAWYSRLRTLSRVIKNREV